ncbi:MAG: hypothetical protein AVDCRST_MAG87-4030 [uncultured Thermomicrobiales bacterium]|uniref:Bacteriocin-protection protein n=1 Tax=uncultured Thermomicrobiales bacterium TaxID=1645740 RepID=A0A6J4VXT8_9BACT|nr:MAG: hypothetical protein AVDCRST_MAG87-4030 [uncultured Thermomicrobiales bacterium]
MTEQADPAEAVNFFEDGEAFRVWLAEHHDSATELWVGIHKKASGNASLVWAEAVDEALCYGWIDGLTKRIDDLSYKIRFTPRKPRSTWSVVNLKRVPELIAEGRMRESGLRAYERRTDARSAIYAHEQAEIELDPAMRRLFQANAPAWAFFESAPPSYRRAATWWVISAKREETRQRRLRTLIDDSAQGRWIALLRRETKPGQDG